MHNVTSNDVSSYFNPNGVTNAAVITKAGLVVYPTVHWLVIAGAEPVCQNCVKVTEKTWLRSKWRNLNIPENEGTQKEMNAMLRSQNSGCPQNGFRRYCNSMDP